MLARRAGAAHGRARDRSEEGRQGGPSRGRIRGARQPLELHRRHGESDQGRSPDRGHGTADLVLRPAAALGSRDALERRHRRRTSTGAGSSSRTCPTSRSGAASATRGARRRATPTSRTCASRRCATWTGRPPRCRTPTATASPTPTDTSSTQATGKGPRAGGSSSAPTSGPRRRPSRARARAARRAPQTVTRKIMRTHYGPVSATATVNGAPVAISIQRSTFGAELDTSIPFALVSTSTRARRAELPAPVQRVHRHVQLAVRRRQGRRAISTPASIRSATRDTIPTCRSGATAASSGRPTARLPQGYFANAGGSVPFPVRVTAVAERAGRSPLGGDVEWQNFMPLAQHPQAVNPSKGWIASWNNSPAAGWWAADGDGQLRPDPPRGHARQAARGLPGDGQEVRLREHGRDHGRRRLHRSARTGGLAAAPADPADRRRWTTRKRRSPR